MRNNIFNLLNNEPIDIKKEYDRIYNLFEKKSFYLYNSLLEYVNKRKFINWEYRGRFLNINEMMEYLKIDNLYIESMYRNHKFNIEVLLRYIEFILNMIKICDSSKMNPEALKIIKTLYNNIYSLLEDLNYESLENINNQIIIIEKDAKVTAVAEKHDDISEDVIEYRRFLLKGNITEKKKILLKLADKIEPLDKKMKGTTYASILDDITFLLNSLNLRHNNYKGPNKIEYITSMSEDDLESWYDKTYDMIIGAFILEDYIDSKKEIQELKNQIKNC